MFDISRERRVGKISLDRGVAGGWENPSNHRTTLEGGKGEGHLEENFILHRRGKKSIECVVPLGLCSYSA